MGNICFTDHTLLKQTNDLPLYSLKGRFRCKVVDVYDGDTVTIVLYNRGEYEKYKLRLHGYDSPEMKPPVNAPNRDEIIVRAKAAKQFMEERVLNKICILKLTLDTDKYGRLLGNLYTITKITRTKDVHMNALMLAEGHGYAYTGGTKRTSTSV
jgi:endonuclease YncB( thermonuclease family)